MISLPRKQILDPQAMDELLHLQCHSHLSLYPASAPVQQWSATVSAFANSNGGELYLGLDPQGPFLSPFPNEEALRPVLAALETLIPLSHLYALTLYGTEDQEEVLLHINLCPCPTLVPASDGRIYFRAEQQDLPCEDPEKLRELSRQKGLCSYEEELSPFVLSDLLSSRTLQHFLSHQVPPVEPYEFFRSHCLMNPYTQLRNGAILLFADHPQAMISHRCGIRILRYCSDEYKDLRDDFPESESLLLEGPLYTLIPQAVQTVRRILSEAGIIGEMGLEPIDYPEAALHELITNAVLHRDYSIPEDLKIKIFTNRLEIESPGSLLIPEIDLPRGCQQKVRNPRLVSLMAKFPQAPNRDLGKGLRQAFRAMRDAGLQSPTVHQGNNSVTIILRHERLADAQSLVLDYLRTHLSITNSVARELTGISDANKMKQIFLQLKDKGLLEIVPGTRSTSTQWRSVTNTAQAEIEQLSLF
ncbi:MAG: hypothetical protein IKT58_06275 [Oscillospiraceae bacterium]|nr:hypothetical protein [Oscillospiraceae bacterium]